MKIRMHFGNIFEGELLTGLSSENGGSKVVLFCKKSWGEAQCRFMPACIFLERVFYTEFHYRYVLL